MHAALSFFDEKIIIRHINLPAAWKTATAGTEPFLKTGGLQLYASRGFARPRREELTFKLLFSKL